jgi:hypothetical protein
MRYYRSQKYTFLLAIFDQDPRPFKPYKLKDTPALQASKGITTLKQYNPIDLSSSFTSMMIKI